MSYKTVTVNTDVIIDLDEFETDELIEEMKLRGYTCITSGDTEGFNQEDWQFLLEILDKTQQTWYSRRIRDKIFTASWT